jgi:hypothetical protein
MVSSSVIICSVMCSFLCSESKVLVIMSVSFIGMLTFRSLISSVIILRFSFRFSLIKLQL